MLVTFDISTDALAAEAKARGIATRVVSGCRAGLIGCVHEGAQLISAMLATGELGLNSSGGLRGLAGSVDGWWLFRNEMIAALGVPSDSDAAAYATIQNYGGRIVPRNAKALAIPVSAEAKRYTSPRDMQGLVAIARKGRPTILARVVKQQRSKKIGPAAPSAIEVAWILVASVYIRATLWFNVGFERSKDAMQKAFTVIASEHIFGAASAGAEGAGQ